MSDIEIGGQKYRIGRLNARKQFHVARRLAPVVPDVIGSLASMKRMVMGEKVDIAEFARLINGGVNGLARMSDADADYVLDECLSVVTMSQMGHWVKIWSPGAGPMFDTLDLAQMAQLVWAVVQTNLMNFFPAPQPTSK